MVIDRVPVRGEATSCELAVVVNAIRAMIGASKSFIVVTVFFMVSFNLRTRLFQFPQDYRANEFSKKPN